jgi:dTDP-4-dehydrorhamnose 3,5-epimerase
MTYTQVLIIRHRRIEDDRGWFYETYNERSLAPLGLTARFVQDNHSLSRPAHTLRGLHLQRPPHAQAKLVRCVRGRTFASSTSSSTSGEAHRALAAGCQLIF